MLICCNRRAFPEHLKSSSDFVSDAAIPRKKKGRATAAFHKGYGKMEGFSESSCRHAAPPGEACPGVSVSMLLACGRALISAALCTSLSAELWKWSPVSCKMPVGAINIQDP